MTHLSIIFHNFAHLHTISKYQSVISNSWPKLNWKCLNLNRLIESFGMVIVVCFQVTRKATKAISKIPIVCFHWSLWNACECGFPMSTMVQYHRDNCYMLCLYVQYQELWNVFVYIHDSWNLTTLDNRYNFKIKRNLNLFSII